MVSDLLVGKKIYVDTNVWIYALEAPHLFPNLQAAFVSPLQSGDLEAVCSWITLAEVLVKPIQNADLTLETYYRRLIHPSVCSMVDVDEQIAAAAATLRAEHGIRLPDAIHIATGQASGCDYFLTSDANWAKFGLPVIDAANL
ncbi:MAG: type II toxin-antitoxin system VapC family toxin [Armatimonadetes bacterium]|nr:type II toxin-antitoxin system VapC family toxin [Armatimonadota bacterium]